MPQCNTFNASLLHHGICVEDGPVSGMATFHSSLWRLQDWAKRYSSGNMCHSNIYFLCLRFFSLNRSLRIQVFDDARSYGWVRVGDVVQWTKIQSVSYRIRSTLAKKPTLQTFWHAVQCKSSFATCSASCTVYQYSTASMWYVIDFFPADYDILLEKVGASHSLLCILCREWWCNSGWRTVNWPTEPWNSSP